MFRLWTQSNNNTSLYHNKSISKFQVGLFVFGLSLYYNSLNDKNANTKSNNNCDNKKMTIAAAAKNKYRPNKKNSIIEINYTKNKIWPT